MSFVLSLFSHQLLASENSIGHCNNDNYSNRYYLINVKDVANASFFFNSLAKNYLGSMEGFSGQTGKRQRVETFFDYPDLRVLKNKMSLSLTVDENLPEYRSERKWISYRDNNSDPPKIQEFEVRKYNKKFSVLDKHPLFGILKRSERPLLQAELEKIGDFEPNSLHKNLAVSHDEFVFLIVFYGKPQASIVLDTFHISAFGMPNTFNSFRIEKSSKQSKELNEAEQQVLNSSLCNIVEGFEKAIPSLNPQQDLGYAEYTSLAKQLVPTRDLFIQYPLLFKMAQVIILVLIGFMILYLFVNRYQKKNNYRIVVVQKQPGNDDHQF